MKAGRKAMQAAHGGIPGDMLLHRPKSGLTLNNCRKGGGHGRIEL